jgi:hypothetical protein
MATILSVAAMTGEARHKTAATASARKAMTIG